MASLRDLCVFAPLREPPPEEGSPFLATAQRRKVAPFMESQFEGDLDLRGFLGLSDRVRNGYENIRVTFKITVDAPEEKLQELCQPAQKRSPVFDIVSNPVQISVRLETK
jgi:OsmC-like protein